MRREVARKKATQVREMAMVTARSRHTLRS
jgi:hypothetical protein